MRGFEEVMYAALALMVSAIVAYIFISNTNLPTYSVSKPIESMKTSFELVDYGIIYPNTLVIYLRPTSPVNISNVIVYINRQKTIVKKIGNTPGDIVDPNKGDLIMVSLDNFQGNSVDIFVSGYNLPSRSFSINLEGKRPLMPANITRYFYRIPITIKENSGSNLRDYQVNVIVNTQALISVGKMRADCGDIRFTDTNGNKLSYWVESGCNTLYTKIWIKIPSIPANGQVTIYMYYGNPSTTSESNADSTMFIYENFTIPPRGNLAGSATYDSTNQWVQLTPADTQQRGYLYYTKVPTNPTGFYVKFWFWAGGGNGADAIWVGAYDTNYQGTTEDIVNGGYHFTFDEFQDKICFTKSTTDNGDGIFCTYDTNIDNGQWHLGEVYFWYNGTLACTKIYYDSKLYVSACDPNVQPNVINGVGQFIFGGRTGGLTNYHRIGNGLMYVVKYIYPEPSISLGNEEITFYYPS